jgi:hypothetical protein
MSDPQGDLIEWSIETSPDVGSTSTIGDTNGSKNCTISGLQHETTYTWFVNATDSYNWTNETFTFTTLKSTNIDFGLFQHSVLDWFLTPYKTYFDEAIWLILFACVIGLSWALSKNLTAVMTSILITFACYGATNAFLNEPQYSLFFSIIAIASMAGAIFAFIKSMKGDKRG